MADTEDNEPTLEQQLREAQALDNAIAQAAEELNAISAAASDADRLAEQSEENCSIHEVSGVGRYAIPAEDGWAALLDVVHDKSVDINYSPNNYPAFDGVIQNVTRSPYLDDPDEPKYDSRTFIHLRDNIAAVRNFLMQTYYANTPEGMSSVDARRALEEIATFVGEGLLNNERFGGFIPYHDVSKPYIDLGQASEPNGAGAQYIYEEILKQQRQSNWWRPFAAVVALFGGKKPEDWMLPSALETPFLESNAAIAEKGHLAEEAVAQRLRNLEAERGALEFSIEQTALAVDMEAMGNQLLGTVDRLNDVSQLSEPVQRTAIDIAKDILRKLKVTIGDKNLLDGLQMKPQDDRQALGGILGAAHVYERLLAWGRGIDASIAQHPSIMAATQAVGQLGYLAKLEALRVAQSIGNGVLADRIAARIAALPAVYKNVNASNFGELLNRVEGGIDTVLNRIQEIQGPGAGLGHTPSKDLGSYMGAPIAGLARQLTGDGANRDSVGKRNSEVLAAEEAVAQAQASRIQSQTADRARQQGQQAPQPQARGARGQQQVQAARQQQQRQGTAITNQANLNMMTAQQRAAYLSRVNAANIHHDDHHDHVPVVQKVNPALNNPALAKIKADLAKSGVNTNDLTTGKAAFNKMKSANTQGLTPLATPNVKPKAVQPVLTEEQKKKQQLLDNVAPGAPKGPHGYGR